jgi:serine/threonine protein kinase
MKFVASKNFVHMDLAARNVLVAPDGLLKIADFGLTHAFDEGCQYYKQLGVLKLSIRWLAIDSFDHKLFSEASDVWSWGVLLWELYSYGTQPYKGHKLPEVLRLVRSGLRLAQPKSCPASIFALMSETWNIDRFKRSAAACFC